MDMTIYLECKKQYDCNEEYGVDLLVGKKYRLESSTKDGTYVSTENGSSLLLSDAEMQKYFV